MVVDAGAIFLFGFTVGVLWGLIMAYMFDRLFDIYGGDDVVRLNKSLNELREKLNSPPPAIIPWASDSTTQRDIHDYPE